MEPSKPDLGVYYELLEQISAPSPTLSFLAGNWADVDSWRNDARKKVLELMDFGPKDVPAKSDSGVFYRAGWHQGRGDSI
jgi:hypothetical protein